MSSLEAPAKEYLEQELLAFKHLAILPESIEDITFKVQLLTMTSEYQMQLYSNYRQQKNIHHRMISEVYQKLSATLNLAKPQETQLSRGLIVQKRANRRKKLWAELGQLKEIFALDKAEVEKAADKVGCIEQDILQCVAFELEAFKKIKDKEGKAFKYFDVTEEELRKVAEKRFEKALEAVRFVQQKSKAKKI